MLPALPVVTFQHVARSVSKLAQGLYVGLGFFLVALAIVGIFLPVLPTTVWLLLAAGCFMRGSERAYRWLMKHKLFGRYIRNYRDYRGITKKQKVFTLALLWTGISISALLLVDKIWVTALLFAIAVGVTTHIFTLKTLPEHRSSQSEP